MRRIFSEKHKYELWRKLWVNLTQAQFKKGLVSKKELDDLVSHESEIDIDRILALEQETKHDVVAAIREYAEKAVIGGGKIHLGATSMDIVDNADAIRQKEALAVISKSMRELLDIFSKKIMQYKDVPCMGYTHLQPAEPTTVGYRLSVYAYDLLLNFSMIDAVSKNLLKAKGLKGAVGTAASYQEILLGKRMSAMQLEKDVLCSFDIEPHPVSTQVYPRVVDYYLLSVLAGIGTSLSKFATDIRMLQSPAIGEWAEPFGKSQVGSSAMPFKKNPISSEKICSLGRYLTSLPAVFSGNASLSILERTLDDSANKRVAMPEAFLALDEILVTAQKITEGLVIDEKRIAYNLSKFEPFAGTERIIIAAVKKGANRQEMHERIRKISMKAWTSIQKGKVNTLVRLLYEDKRLLQYLSRKDISKLIDSRSHVGDAPKRALKLAKRIAKYMKGKI
jgi:adenylosuccinate lyase